MRRTGLAWFGAGLGGSETVRCTPQNLHPVSRGTVTIDLEDPEGREPIVDYRGAVNPIDIDIVVEYVKFWRRYVSSGILAPYNATETEPGPGYETDEALRGWVKRTLVPSLFHPIGTAAKMKREWGGVVDEELLVYGVKGLSVVDASIMPTLVGATTSMTVYAIAEKVSLGS